MSSPVGVAQLSRDLRDAETYRRSLIGDADGMPFQDDFAFFALGGHLPDALRLEVFANPSRFVFHSVTGEEIERRDGEVVGDRLCDEWRTMNRASAFST